ncbi:MAG TPA: TIGR03621 family F420-dependent LLM class oxidoreductase [Candidatus Limnocylindrales bacterium]|nr:TIGR03621 family F420-dependent LLM class oxidoreductase [Candidatus Limnocylindrales bacterium]
MRPFQLLAGPGEVTDAHSLAAAARRAESIGIDVLVVTDHLIDQLAPLAAMTAAAGATERLRVGTFVFNNDLRHPAVLAQELASIDVLSGGRLQVGIGAGWNEPEYAAIGLPFEPVRVRQARLIEAIAVLKGCFADGSSSFVGEHYAIHDYDARPKPLQRPHPPFLIGGGGRRTLELAAREAQIVGLAPRILAGQRTDPRSITVAGTAEKIGWARDAARERFGDLRLNVYPSGWPVTVTDHPRSVAAQLVDRFRSRTGIELTEDEVLDSPHVFVGSIDGLETKIREQRDRLGIDSIMVGELGELDLLVERLAGT